MTEQYFRRKDAIGKGTRGGKERIFTLSAIQEVRCLCHTRFFDSPKSIQVRQSAHLIRCGSMDATSGSDISGLYMCVSESGYGCEGEVDPLADLAATDGCCDLPIFVSFR
jgi:hypothetical protein